MWGCCFFSPFCTPPPHASFSLWFTRFCSVHLTDGKIMLSFKNSWFTGKNSQTKEEYMTKKKALGLGMAALLAGWAVSASAETAPEIGGTSIEHPHSQQIAGSVPLVSLGGQYRINAYTLNDDDGAGDIAAARVRFRQNIDLKFSERFSTHIQLNIGHINEGIGNHNLNQDSDASVGLRHAIMNYKFSDPALLKAGLVPISDKFGDTLFSSDWDFNPLTLAWLGKIGGADIRLSTAELVGGGP